MKSLLFYLSILLFTTTPGVAQKFEVEGRIEGLKEGMLYLYHHNQAGAYVKDSFLFAGGRFMMSGTVLGAGIAHLYLKEEEQKELNNVSFFLEPVKMKILLREGAFDKAQISGSATQVQYVALGKAKARIELKYQKQTDSLEAEKDPIKRDAIRERLSPCFLETNQQDIDFIEAHPKSAVSAYILQLHYTDLSLAQLQRYYDGLGYALQENPSGKAIQHHIIKLRGGSPGRMAKAFATIDMDGRALSLADYKGKFLLIDFWASWCVPCRKGNPHLKELYAKYKSRGLEILGVSDDDHAAAAWRQAVAKDDIAVWKHVLRGYTGKADNDSDIHEKFAIQTLPTKILINPEGKIIGRYSSDEAPLDAKLAEVFK